jgi:triphosphatase
VEIELKLRLPQSCIPRLQRSSLLKSLSVSRPVTRKLYSIYYDTPTLDLKKKNVALRLRRDGRRWVQTVKGGGDVAAGMHQRQEWETPVLKAQPDLTKISGTSLADFFHIGMLREELRPVFATDFNRTIRKLLLPGGQEVEFCLDRGEITVEGASVAFCEIELELKGGDPSILFQLALDLLHSFPSSIPIRLENASKAERGYALASGMRAPPRKARPVSISPEMNIVQTFRGIAWDCLNHLNSNEAGMLEHAGTEYLHQMRVALRRERSALNIFSRALGKETFGEMGKELRWLSNQLGPARDWDVFITETLAPVCSAFPEHRGMRVLKEKCDKIREKYNDYARSTVDSSHYTGLMLKLGAWLSQESWSVNDLPTPGEVARIPSEVLVTEFAEPLLERRHRQLRKYGKNLEALDLAQLHWVRIAAKKQRYATEFFAALYSHKETRRYIETLSDLQDILGAINDVATVERNLTDLVIDNDSADEHEASGIIRGWGAGLVHVKKMELTEAWKSFGKSKTFW